MFEQTLLVETIADDTDSKRPSSYHMFAYQDSIRQLNCKKSAQVYSIHDANGGLVGLKRRPDICASPFCPKCTRERQERLMLRYLPYLDDSVYPRSTLRHIIATTPDFPRDELGSRIDQLLLNTSRFHEKMRKTYKYPFNSLVLHELKFNPETNRYYFHCHYGVLSFVNISKVRQLWAKTWGLDLTVKFPSFKGKPQFFTSKLAYLEYATRRKVNQALTIPPEDYYNYLMHRQLFKRIGFSKAITRKLTTIRKSYSWRAEFPEDWSIVYLGNIDSRLDLDHFGERYRTNYEAVFSEKADICTVKVMARLAFKDTQEAFESREVGV